jgi:hypothetical protein
MVKIRRESNEDLAPDQLPPVEGIKMDLERLVHLRKVTFKEARLAQPKPKRIAKPRKKVQRSYRAVTDLDAQQIWNRK